MPRARRGPRFRFGNKKRGWTRLHSEGEEAIPTPNTFHLEGHWANSLQEEKIAWSLDGPKGKKGGK